MVTCTTQTEKARKIKSKRAQWHCTTERATVCYRLLGWLEPFSQKRLERCQGGSVVRIKEYALCPVLAALERTTPRTAVRGFATGKRSRIHALKRTLRTDYLKGAVPYLVDLFKDTDKATATLYQRLDHVLTCSRAARKDTQSHSFSEFRETGVVVTRSAGTVKRCSSGVIQRLRSPA